METTSEKFFTGRGCLGENTGSAFVEGTLGVQERLGIEAHVDTCADCRGLLSRLAVLQEQVPGEGQGTSWALVSPGPSTDQRYLAELPPERLAPGTQAGRYTIQKLVGSGGMGCVYAAYDPELERKIALKLLHPQRAGDEEAAPGATKTWLIEEARAMARIAHRNVIAVYDLGTCGAQVFIAMEYIEGSTLGQWVRMGRRSWREILGVYVQAGRGLEAAHGAGLVHRDFKPDNVLVGRRGGVFVTDFGLARRAPGLAPGTSAPPVEGNAGGGSLTGTGVIVGTPAYMAPEQHRRQGADARSDQFSYCVALYEALYGQRPFGGGSAEELAESVMAGRLRPVPAGQRVPRFLERALRRGLSAEPDARFPSMEALLSELQTGSESGRRWVVGSVLCLLGVLGLGQVRMSGRRLPCTEGERRLAGVWDAERKAAVRAAFVATHVPYAQAAWSNVERMLDGYAYRWVVMHKDACEATKVRGDQSEQVLSLRTVCLERELTEARELVGALAGASAQVVEDAVPAVARLPRVEECANIPALLRAPRGEADGKRRAQSEELRRELASAKTLKRLGRYPESVKRLEALAGSAEKLADPAVTAEVLLELGDAYVLAGEVAPGEQTLYRALEEAERAGYDMVKARAWGKLARLVGYIQGHHEQGRRFAALAQVSLERSGGDELRAELLTYLAGIAMSQGDAVLARRQMEQVLVIQQRVFGAEHYQVGRSLHDLGLVLGQQGDYEGARSTLSRGIAVLEKALGSEHPHVAEALDTLCSALDVVGDYDAALACSRRAMAIAERTLSGDHPQVADSLNMLALTLMKAEGNFTAAEELLKRSLAIHERTEGAQSNRAAVTLLGLGQVQMAAGQPRRAAESCERALTIATQLNGGNHYRVAQALHCRATAKMAAGRWREARSDLERAVPMLERLRGPETTDLIESLPALARVLIALGDPGGAIPLGERALALGEKLKVSPIDRTVAQFALAQALWETRGDRPRAKRLAEQARAVLATRPAWKQRPLHEVDAWLRSR